MTPRRTQTIRTTRELARVIVSLPAPGPLPLRTVLVPNGRIAHALRRELLAIGRPDALAGTLFSTPVVAAHEILAARGATILLGEEQRGDDGSATRPRSTPGADASCPPW